MTQKNEYDLFEKFSNGSSLWRGSFPGFEAACFRLQELAQKTKNQFYAISLTTGEVVALDSGGNARKLLAPPKTKLLSKGQAA